MTMPTSCIFCNEQHAIRIIGPENRKYYVECMRCHARGPIAGCAKAAAREWNSRAKDNNCWLYDPCMNRACWFYCTTEPKNCTNPVFADISIIGCSPRVEHKQMWNQILIDGLNSSKRWMKLQGKINISGRDI